MPVAASVLFEEFTGGDTGRDRPSRPQLNQFRALNAWVYPNGAIGPRPPWQNCAITGLPQLSVACFDLVRNVNGSTESQAVLSYALNTTVPNSQLWSAAAAQAAPVFFNGTFGQNALASAVWGNTVYYCSGAGTGASYNIFTGTVAAIAGMPAGNDITALASRMILSNSGGAPGQIRVSAADDPTTWPAGNFINVGAPVSITGMHELRNALVLLRYDGTVWQITGVPTVNGIVRKVDQGLAPAFQFRARAEVVGQSNLWAVAGRSMVKYTGANLLTLNRPDIPIQEADKATYIWTPSSDHVGHVLPLPGDDEFIVVGTLDQVADNAIHKVWAQVYRERDQWTRHTIPMTPFRFTLPGGGGTLTQGSRDEATAVQVANLAPAGVAFLVSNSQPAGTSARPPTTYRCNTRQEFPHVAVGTVLAAGQTSSTLNDADSSAPTVAQFRTAEVWADDPQYSRAPNTLLHGDTWSQGFTQVRVRAVQVDLSYVAVITPHSTYNKFTIAAEALQRDVVPGTAVAISAPQAYVAPTVTAPDPDADGLVRLRVKFQMGDQGWGAGFRIILSDWVGIMVHRIEALVDLDGPRY